MKIFHAGVCALCLLMGCSPVPPQTPAPNSQPTTMVSIPTFFNSRSDWDVTIAVAAPQTEVAVGNSISVTVVVTNTGKLGADKAICDLRGWLNRDKTDSNISTPIPLFESALEKVDRRGLDMACVYGLHALQPGTVWLEGHYGGEILIGVSQAGGGPIGEWVGKDSPLLEIHIK